MLQKLPLDHWLRLATVGFIATTGLGILTILPLVLGELHEHYDFSKELIGWFAAINITGIAFGGLITALVIHRVGMVRLIQIGLLGLMGCEIASMFLLDSPYLLVLRLVAGMFAGVAYASSLTSFTVLKTPVKGYSIYVLVYCLLSAIIFPFMPSVLHNFGLQAGFVFLVGMTILALLVSPSLAVFQRKSHDFHLPPLQLSALVRNPTILLVLLAYYALQLSGGVLWAYIELIGEAKMLSEHFIANTLSIGNVIVIPFALVIYWFNDKGGLALPIFGGLGIFAVSLLAIYFTSSPWGYAIGTVFYMGIWAFIMAFYQSIQAQHDPQGKVIALGAFINMLGQATGPALAAMFLGNQPYVNIVGLALVGLTVSFAGIFSSVLALERKVVPELK
ncbi:MAG: MFS transporter [Chitinophagales bacterium]